MHMKENKYINWALIVIGIPFAFIYYRFQAKEEAQPKQHPDAEDSKVMTIKLQSLEFENEFSGNYVPVKETQVRFKVSGVLESLPNSPKVGSRVKKNDLLFQLNNSALFDRIYLEKKALKAELEKRLPQIQQAFPSESNKWTSYLNAITLNDLLPECPEFRSAAEEQLLASFEITSKIGNIQKLEDQVFDYFYLSPCSGIVSSLLKKAGSRVSKGETIACIADPKAGKVRFSCPRNKIPFLKQEARIKIVSPAGEEVYLPDFQFKIVKHRDGDHVQVELESIFLPFKPSYFNQACRFWVFFGTNAVKIPNSAIREGMVQISDGNQKFHTQRINVLQLEGDSSLVEYLHEGDQIRLNY